MAQNIFRQIDGMYSPSFYDKTGCAESGTWATTWSSGLPSLTRTSNNDTTEYYHIPIPLETKITSNKGVKIKDVKVAYNVTNADTGDDIQIHLCKRTMPSDNSAPSSISTIAGDANTDYDSSHNTAALRSNSTGGHANNTMTMSVPEADKAYIAEGESWFLRVKVIQANDITKALSVIIKDINIYYDILTV